MLNAQEQTTLRIYLFYRLTLGAALASLFFIDQTFQVKADYQNSQYFGSAVLYFFLCSLSFIFHKNSSTTKHKAIYSIFIVDIVSLSLILHFSGGIASGIATLLIIPVATGAIFFKRLVANFIAAITTLVILLDTILYVWQGQYEESIVITAGLYGIALFATSFFIQNLARRIRTTQTELEVQHDEILYLQQLNQHIVKRLRTGIVVLSAEGKIKLSNDAAMHLLGEDCTSKKVISGPLLTHFKAWKNSDTQWLSSFQQAQGLTEVRVSFILNDSDENSGDIIAFIESNRELTQQAQQIKLASLGRLSASIAHEIRNPLSAISHSTQLLNESPHIHTDDQRLLEIINSHIQRLNGIITSTLNISKRAKPMIEKIHLNEFIDNFCQQMQNSHNENVELIINIEQAHYTLFDKGQLSQVLTNLVENALFYSHKNNAGYWARMDFCEDKNQQTLIKIYDKGIGIMTSDIEKIFEPFYTTSAQGTGLGLFLAKDLCQLNQAELDYVNEGTQAYFQVRLSHPQKNIS